MGCNSMEGSFAPLSVVFLSHRGLRGRHSQVQEGFMEINEEDKLW